jgi:SAM-dependent methyltransferase
MESADESARLLEQERAIDSRIRLLESGLQKGMSALDAGCGPGSVALQMLDIVGEDGRVTGFDLSPVRIDDARKRTAAHKNADWQVANILDSKLGSGVYDYSWSQYVLEYLPQPQRALAEMVRMTKPGGKVVVSEIDGLGTLNWPQPTELEDGMKRFIAATAALGVDINIGRKLFHMFRQQGLQSVEVRAYPFYIAAGSADVRLTRDWETRFKTLEAPVNAAFGGVEPYRAFCQEYLAMLANPDSLKVTLSFVTSGVVPSN